MKRMKKGITGDILMLVVFVITGIIAIVVIWMFLSGSITIIYKAVDKAITGIKCWLCSLLGPLKPLCGECP